MEVRGHRHGAPSKRQMMYIPPIVAILGQTIKVEVGKQIDLWLKNENGLEQWENNALPKCDRRVLSSTWIATAVHIVDYCADYRFRLFERTRNLMTNGKGDKIMFPQEIDEAIGIHVR